MQSEVPTPRGSSTIGQPPDIEPPKQPRRFRFSMRTLLIVFALISAALAIFVYVVAQTGVGRAIAQSRDMTYLEEHGFKVAEYSEPTAEQEDLLRYLPREGVLTPLRGYSRDNEIVTREMLDVLSKYSTWEHLILEVKDIDDLAFKNRLGNWTSLQRVQLRSDLGSASIPSFENHTSLVRLFLDAPNCDSSILRNIAAAPALQQLSITPGISDEGLIEILQMPNLTYLHLNDNTAITGAHFAAAKSPRIELLEVARTRFGDEGFKAVIRWPAIRSVWAAGTQITDAAFREIPAESTSQLRKLGVGNTTVTSAALPDIAAFSGLTDLDVSDTAVGDDNLEQLNKLPALDFLVMTNCKVTDAGLMKLQSKTLRVLLLEGTQVTAAGFADINIRLPKLETCFLKGLSQVEIDKLRTQFPNVEFFNY